jgi:hypothetical protein
VVHMAMVFVRMIWCVGLIRIKQLDIVSNQLARDLPNLRKHFPLKKWLKNAKVDLMSLNCIYFTSKTSRLG